MTPVEGMLLLGLGSVAGFMNVMSAGGSMLTLPLLLFMGLEGPTANGTNRVAIALQNLTAVGRFARHGQHAFGVGWRLAAPAVIGSLAGAWLATLVSAALFEGVLVAVMIGCTLLMLLPQPHIDTQPLTPARLTPWAYLALFGIGLYGGFIQVGVGVLFIAVLHRLLKIDLVQVNVLKVFIVLIYTLPALGVFIASGNVQWSYGVTLALGNMLGAWLATKVTLGPMGAQWIRYLTLGVIGLIVLKLLLT